MLSLINAFRSAFTPAAPGEQTNDVGNTVPAAPPEGGWNDPLGASRAPVYQAERFHVDHAGFEPAWRYVQPPGVGDAPQHAFATRVLAPVSLDGPGDRPASYFRWKVAPVVAHAAMRMQGMAVDGGGFMMTGLYVPQPLELAANDIYAGS